MTQEAQTPSKPTVIEALRAVMEDVQAVGKDGRNTQQNYNFRGIDAVVNAVGPAFRKHGVLAVPHKSDARYRDVRTSNDKPSRECTVTVTYRFYGPAGDFIDAEVPGESMDFGDKGTPKAMSVAFRILLLQTLCIPTHEPDPDATSYERSGPAETVTDPAWLARMESSINSAATPAQLDAIAAEIRTESRYGRVDPIHGEHLLHVFQQRQAVLAEASEPGPPTVSAVASPTVEPSGDDPVTKELLHTLAQQFGAVGVIDRDEGLMTIALLTGVKVTATKELTIGQAAQLIGVLEPLTKAADPSAALTKALEAAMAAMHEQDDVIEGEIITNAEETRHAAA